MTRHIMQNYDVETMKWETKPRATSTVFHVETGPITFSYNANKCGKILMIFGIKNKQSSFTNTRYFARCFKNRKPPENFPWQPGQRRRFSELAQTDCEWMNEWMRSALKCVRKPTRSRLSLTHHANKSSRWLKCTGSVSRNEIRLLPARSLR